MPTISELPCPVCKERAKECICCPWCGYYSLSCFSCERCFGPGGDECPECYESHASPFSEKKLAAYKAYWDDVVASLRATSTAPDI